MQTATIFVFFSLGNGRRIETFVPVISAFPLFRLCFSFIQIVDFMAAVLLGDKPFSDLGRSHIYICPFVNLNIFCILKFKFKFSNFKVAYLKLRKDT